jgi:SNF2 family DNA or RNA helicase
VLEDKIPDLTVETTEVEFMSEGERREYQRVQNNVREEYQELMELGGEARDENVALFELLLRLRQAAQHPQLVRNGFSRKFMKGKGLKMRPYRGSSSKHMALFKMLEEEGKPALVFCHFREEINILQTICQEKGLSNARIDGQTSAKDRAALVRQMLDINKNKPKPWSSSMCQVLLIQIAAGGVGLNLQAYDRVYLLSPDWNPCNEIQAIGRAHRLGQKSAVVVRRLVLVDPKDEFSVIDKRILAVQQNKRDLISDLLSEPKLRENGKATRFRLSKTETKKLLGIC